MFSISKVTAIVALALSGSLVSAATVPPPQGNFVGSATLFRPNGGLTACGTTPQDTDRVAGVSKEIFAQFGNTTTGNAVCNALIFVTSPDTGNSVSAAIQEQCATCGTNDILLSGAAFSALADPSVGVIENVNWGFIFH